MISYNKIIIDLKKIFMNKLKTFDEEVHNRKRMTKFSDIYYSIIFMNGNKKSYTALVNHLESKGIMDISSSAISQKRNVIDAEYMEKFNLEILNYIYSKNKNKTEGRLIAVDGSQLNLHFNLSKYGYPLSCNGKFAVGMMSCLFDVDKEMPINYTLFKHKNEREALLSQLIYLEKNDTLIVDRGYFSEKLYGDLIKTNKQLKVIFRLKKNLAIVKKIMKLNNVYDTIVTINNMEIRILRYSINGKEYYLGTNIFDKDINYFIETYWKRWKIEVHFRHCKYNLSLKELQSKSENKIKQDIAAHHLIFIINSYLDQIVSNSIDKKKYKINTKNSLDLICSKIFYNLFYKKSTIMAISKFSFILKQIRKHLVLIKKNRKYKRVKIKPSTKWNEHGNRYHYDFG